MVSKIRYTCAHIISNELVLAFMKCFTIEPGMKSNIYVFIAGERVELLLDENERIATAMQKNIFDRLNRDTGKEIKNLQNILTRTANKAMNMH